MQFVEIKWLNRLFWVTWLFLSKAKEVNMCNNCIKVFITINAILSICFSFTDSSFALSYWEIFYYDGTTITQLTENNRFDESLIKQIERTSVGKSDG
jgi:hypothetical protein